MDARLHLYNPYGMDFKNVMLGIGVACVGAYTLSCVMYGNRRKRLYEPDVIKGAAFHGCKNDIEYDMKSYLKLCQRKYGDLFTLRMGNGEYSTFIMDNKMMKRVLYNKNTDFNKPSKTSKLRFGLNEIMNAQNGAEILSKALHHGFADRENRNKLIQSIETETKRILKSLIFESNRNKIWNYSSLKLHEWIRNIVIKIELNVLFGALFANDKELIDLYFDFEKAVPLRLNGAQRVMFDDKINKLLNKIDALCCKIEHNHKYNDCALPHGIWIANKFCKDNNYSKDSRNRLIIQFLWGSLSNSSHTMSWMMYHVLQSEKCKHRILNELEFQRHIFDVNSDDSSNFRLSEIRVLLPSLSSLINEVFRHYGESNICRYILDDIVVKDDDHKQHKLRAGDWVVGSSSFLHRNPKYFANPDTFIFDRFVDYGESRFNQKQAKNLFTFGSKCVGRGFAGNLIVILCGFLVYNIDFEIIDANKKGAIPRVGHIGSFSIPSINEDDDMRFKWRKREYHPDADCIDVAVYQSLVYGNNQLLLQRQNNTFLLSQ